MFLVSRVFRDLAGPCPPLLNQPLLTEGWFAKTESTSWQTSLFPWSDKVVFFCDGLRYLLPLRPWTFPKECRMEQTDRKTDSKKNSRTF